MFDKFWEIEKVEFIERSIKNENLSQLYLIRKELIKDPQMDRTNPFFDNLMYSVNTINWVWTNMSNPFNVENSLLQQKIEEIEESLKYAEENNYSISTLIEAVLNQINKIKVSSEAPLFDEMEMGLDKKKRICFVPVDVSFHWLSKHIGGIGNNFKEWSVRKPTQLRKNEFFDEMVILGDLRSIFGMSKHEDKSIEFLLTAPRAEKIYHAHYDWIPVKWKPEFFLLGSESKFFTEHFENIFSDKTKQYDIDEDLIPKINEEKYSNMISFNLQRENSDIESTVKAQAYLLAETNENKSLFAFVEKDKNAYAIDDFDGDGTLDIWSKSADEIGKGMYLLRRTEGADKDVLEIIADTFLSSDAKKLRGYQKKWKSNLQDKVDELGKDNVVKKLKDSGCKAASLQNLNNWLSPETMRTRDARDFYKILEFSETVEDHKTIWNAMRKINAAHNKAGVELMKRLKNKIEFLDSSYLNNETKKDIMLSDDSLGTVSAYLIEEKLNENYTVPRSWTTWGVKEMVDG